MNIETAEWCYNELRENLPGPAGDARDALSAVVKLHRPSGTHFDRPNRPAICWECASDADRVSWPCPTIVEINAYAHVDLST